MYLSDYGYGLLCNDANENIIEIINPVGVRNFICVHDEYVIDDWQRNLMSFNSKVILYGQNALRLIAYLNIQPEVAFTSFLPEKHIICCEQE